MISQRVFGIFVQRSHIDNCIEHLDSPMKVIEEIHRLLKVGGEVEVIVRYFTSPSAHHDPTHKTFYTVVSFAYYDPSHPIFIRYDYTKARFSVENIVFHENLKSGFFKSRLVMFSNKWPSIYENCF